MASDELPSQLDIQTQGLVLAKLIEATGARGILNST
jgi:hypothetical protein